MLGQDSVRTTLARRQVVEASRCADERQEQERDPAVIPVGVPDCVVHLGSRPGSVDESDSQEGYSGKIDWNSPLAKGEVVAVVGARPLASKAADHQGRKDTQVSRIEADDGY